MDLRLSGKRALVTGASAGLGAEIAATLAQEGAAVIVHGRDRARTEQVARVVDGQAVIGDLATDDGAAAVAAAAGEVDILVNNAGFYDPATGWADADAGAWAEIYNVNVLSSVRLIQKLVPAMRAKGWGRVIQISSVTGEMPAAAQPHYAASNAARLNLARSLARDLKHTGVTSNAIAAGGILVTTTRDYLMGLASANGWGDTWEEVERNAAPIRAGNDVGRIGRPREYADLVAYLASPIADYITGATIRMDGGRYDQ
ncbi:NAD(P)-dependent dehydrogenase (short-subunit alcohol dehydrogenase family) [Asanoa ferruginea]|uniref:NAD(P)-dependent dehydrogenase (Short-subunit alcohol dehydrogenase family) n=1 Tax=Asanoa ferruginea TaxID=53367 RepID=A0A3D9ZXN4_9ACTN|nr:SDR family oxidoreductase [Asanoa ferruginea]REG01375.1 NAD(P)-dependent dehydrogenase (short-subunit alcohol dehydrogenase family) [Asanoa ferruginea]GIF48000.1 3-oxoacyl-ACP reductase [Asanoa ferruginea]